MKNIVLLLLASGLSFQAYAVDKRKDLQEHVMEQGNTIITPEMRNELEKLISSRSTLKNQEDIAMRERAFYETETEKTKAQMRLEREVFISENVPITYIIAGEKAVTQYIVDNFINNQNDKTLTAKTLWSSNGSALIQLEEPVGRAPIINSAIIAPVNILPIPEPEPVDEMTEAEKKKIAESLGALGLSVDQAGAIAENKPLPKQDEPVNKNILIQKIDVHRVVIMGKITAVDATLFINIMNGFNKRDITLPVNSMSPGTQFMVDGVPFELSKVSESEVVFTNTQTGISFKEIVR